MESYVYFTNVFIFIHIIRYFRILDSDGAINAFILQ